MIRLQSSGWQTTMIDLCLILFLLTSAALSEAGPGLLAEGEADKDLADHDNASATYSAVEGAPSLGDWLAEQSPDPRQRLTIHAAYRPGEASVAAARGLELLSEAGPAAATAKLVLEPALETRITAQLGYDMPPQELARDLLEASSARQTGDGQ